MKEVELEIVSAVDQSIPLKNKDVQDSIFKHIDAVIERAIVEKDPCMALDVGKNLLGVVRVGGLGLAKLLHTLNARWGDFECAETLYDLANQELGLEAKATVDRYVAVWEMLSGPYIAKSDKKFIEAKPMRELVPMASLVSQGFDVKVDDWHRLATASNAGEVGDIVRQIKGKPPRKSSMKIVLEADGTLKVWSNNKTKEVGWLNVREEDEMVKKAIDRICDSSGITRR